MGHKPVKDNILQSSSHDRKNDGKGRRMKIFLSTDEVAKLLGISARQVHKQCQLGRLPFVRNGQNIRIPVKAWDAFVEAQTTAAMAALKGEDNAHAV
ncbi:MAG: helix-turn-helix domain-containing protein [Janthinobacterium lividum]